MTTVEFFEFRKAGSRKPAGVAALIDAGLFCYVPAMNAWIKDNDLLADHSAKRKTWQWTSVSSGRAATLTRNVKWGQRESDGAALDRYASEPERRGSVDLGLDIDLRAKRVSADIRLIDAVRSELPGRWTPARRFAPDQAAAARKWVSEVRTGQRKRFQELGPLDAVLVRLEDGTIEARVRRSTQGEGLVALAQSLAATAHGMQKDATGTAYIDEPRRVAQRLAAQGETASVVAAAWLHNVLSGTTMTAADMRAGGVPDEVVEAIEVVTKVQGESAVAYVRRLKASGIGLKVKLAEIADDSDPARMMRLDDATRRRLQTEYAHMLGLLDLAGPGRHELEAGPSAEAGERGGEQAQ